MKSAGLIRIRQSGSATRTKIDAYKVIAAYHDSAAETDIELPLIPDEGVGQGVGLFGPWTIYMADYSICEAFAKEVPVMTVEGVTLEVTPLRLIEDEPQAQPMIYATGPVISPYLEEKGCWLEIQFSEGLAFKVVTKDDIKKALKKMELEVYRGARGQIKMPTEEGAEFKDWKAMGKNMETDRSNFTVIPRSGSVLDFPWPPFIKVYSDHVGMHFDLKYRMGGKAAEEIHGTYGGCKAPLSLCKCTSREPRASTPRGVLEREAFEEREAKRARTAGEAYDAWQSVLRKPDRDCPHLGLLSGLGRCRNGSRCSFRHPSLETCAKIQCDRPKSARTGICDVNPRCIYSPCVAMQRAAAEGYIFGQDEAWAEPSPPPSTNV